MSKAGTLEAWVQDPQTGHFSRAPERDLDAGVCAQCWHLISEHWMDNCGGCFLCPCVLMSAPLCECGGAAVGASVGGPGHSSWCPAAQR